jgi:hypothetical protein
MPWVGFEHTIAASEPAKTVHALDRSATVTGTEKALLFKNSISVIAHQKAEVATVF